MPPQDDPVAIWKEMATFINALPADERHYYQQGIAMVTHNIRHSLAIIFTAESLLRRKLPETPENTELLDMIRNATKRAMFLLTDMAQPFDSGVTIPIGRSTD